MARTKDWTVLVSVVARPFGEVGNTHPHYMNTKADEVRVALENAVGGLDIYAAYNIIYDPSDQDHDYQNREPVAAILNPDPSNSLEMTNIGWFNNGSSGQLESGTALQNNLLGFYAWALARCPSRHCAVFFWGHSFGPAGLFELRSTPALPGVLPQVPSLVPVRELYLPALRPHDVTQIRTVLRKMRVGLNYSPGWQPEGLLDCILEANADAVIERPGTTEEVTIDIVFFQDCWMSTLETAFELKDAAQFVVASQSLVPFGHPSVPVCGLPAGPTGSGVWPYRPLFERLLDYSSNQGGLDKLIETLGAYYDGHDADNVSSIWPNASLPFALLDLRKIDADDVAHALQVLIVALNRLRRVGAIDAEFVEGASIAISGPSACADAPSTNELAAGSIALVDLRMLCQILGEKDLLDDERHAVETLRDTALVAGVHESVDRAVSVFLPGTESAPGRPLTTNLGFRGISFFYYPTTARQATWGKQDEHIFKEVGATIDSYADLRLSRAVERLAGNPDSVEWSSFVLENLE